MQSQTEDAIAKWLGDNLEHVIKHLPPAEEKLVIKVTPSIIMAYCLNCTEGSKDEVTNCPVTKCPLHSHRPWQPKVD